MTIEKAERLAALHLQVVQEHVADERVVKASLEQRALLVITTSGTFVSLQFAVVAVRTRLQSFAVPTSSPALLVAALALFVLAGVLALTVNLPRQQLVLEAKAIEEQFNEGWNQQDLVNVTRDLHRYQALSLSHLRHMNRFKARLLVIALTAEVAAVATLGAAVTIILMRP